MPPELSPDSKFEIGHVLFLDIVGYSKLLIEEQSERLGELTSIVLGTAQVRDSTDEQLVRLPTGDGMALVFHHSAEEPARCALEISEALRKHPELCVRMGIHSGPVREVNDVSGRKNIAGAGINMAQRVMDCGDAGHILMSQHVADDLMQYRQWAPRLRDLGDCEVKHGVRLHLVNLYAEPLGNPEVPEKFRQVVAPASMASTVTTPKRMPWHEVVIALLLVAGVIAAGFFYLRKGAPPPGATAAVSEKSIAVLPFENLSEEKANAFFTEGVQDQILTNLAQIADLKVISRTSVMQYKTGAPRNLREIGQQLGVARVVEGSVQRAANKVRVTAQLIDARTDAHLWAQSYDRDLADVFAIQSEIAKAIADQLQAKLSPNEKKAIEQPPTTDLAAFDLYSRAKSLLLTAGFSITGEPDVRKAIELLGEAVKRDPSFFDAYCQLANAHEYFYATSGSDHTPARLALAEAAVQAATRLRPDAGEAHFARAQYLYFGLRDYAGALAELEIARRALPNDPRLFELSGYILRRRGQPEEGLQNLERAVELDPRNFYTLQQIALSYQGLGRYAEAIAALDRALAIVPDNAETRAGRGLFYVYWKGDTRPLHQTIDAILAQGAGAIASAADIWFFCALVERDPAAAERALVALGDNPAGTNPRFS
jgi:TolB-like protein/Tfp pilus assembly protein PilF